MSQKLDKIVEIAFIELDGIKSATSITDNRKELHKSTETHVFEVWRIR